MKRINKQNKKVTAYQLGGVSDPVSGAMSGMAAGASIGSIFPGIGTAIGAGVGALGGVILGNKAKKDAKRAQRIQENNQLNQSYAAQSNALSNEYWMDNQIVPSFVNGGVAAVNDKEILKYGDSLKKVHAPNTGTDGALVRMPDAVLGGLTIPNTKTTFQEEGARMLEKYKTKSNRKDNIAKNTNELNKKNANKEFMNLLSKQEELKARKGIGQKTKQIADTEVIAAATGLAGVSSLPKSIGSYTGKALTDSMPSSGGGLFNGFNFASAAGILANATPAIYNLIQGTKTPKTEAPINNPYASAYLNNMSKRRVNLSGLKNDLNIQQAGVRSAANQFSNSGQRLAMLHANDIASRSQLQDMHYKQQEYDNAFRNELGRAQYQVGADNAMEQRRVKEINDQNIAKQQQFLSTGISQIGQIGSQVIASENQKEENALMRSTFEKTFGTDIIGSTPRTTALLNRFSQLNPTLNKPITSTPQTVNAPKANIPTFLPGFNGGIFNYSR